MYSISTLLVSVIWQPQARNAHMQSATMVCLSPAQTQQDSSYVYALLHRPCDCNPNSAFPVGEKTSDKDNVLLCSTCVKCQLWTMSGADSSHIVWNSNEKTIYVCAVCVTSENGLCVWCLCVRLCHIIFQLPLVYATNSQMHPLCFISVVSWQ